MALITDRDALVFAQQSYALTFDDLPYIDITREYWSQSMNRDISIHNKLYFSYGDFNLTAYGYTFAMFFNKRIAESVGVSDLYTDNFPPKRKAADDQLNDCLRLNICYEIDLQFVYFATTITRVSRDC